MVGKWKQYRRKGLAEMRPYVMGEDLSEVSVNENETPTSGGMIARDPGNHKRRWYVEQDYYEAQFEEAQPMTQPGGGESNG